MIKLFLDFVVLKYCAVILGYSFLPLKITAQINSKHKNMQSELSEEILAIIDKTQHKTGDFNKAFTDIMALKKGLPRSTQVIRVAKMYAAYRESPEVRAAIGDNIHAMEGWIMPEMYIQVSREIALTTAQ